MSGNVSFFRAAMNRNFYIVAITKDVTMDIRTVNFLSAFPFKGFQILKLITRHVVWHDDTVFVTHKQRVNFLIICLGHNV